jgi:hypothetical protein
VTDVEELMNFRPTYFKVQALAGSKTITELVCSGG